MRKEFLRGDMVLDTSILVEIVFATDIGRELIDHILNDVIRPYTTTLNITETLYIVCRLLGIEEAKKRVNLLVDSGYLEIVNSDNVSLSAAECKCRFPISMVDCHTLALAREYKIPALFYRLENRFKPIVNQLKTWINNEIYFITEK